MNHMRIRHQLSCKEFIAKVNTRKDLLCHLYETGIMTQAMIEKGVFKNLIERLSYITCETQENIKNCICFLSSIHDIGKIHPDFQILTLQNERLEDFNISSSGIKCRHEQFGAAYLNEWLSLNGFLNPEELSSCIYTHHQGYSKGEFAPINKNAKNQIYDIGNNIMEMIFTIYPFSLSIFNKVKHSKNGIFSMISAIVNFCDWAASSADVFDEKRYDDFDNVENYFLHLHSQALTFIKKNYLEYKSLGSRFNNVDDSFSSIFKISQKRPLQEKIYEILQKNNDKPSLYLIEDSCGAGKTESAFHAAIKSNKKASGIYMALPTSATAKSMQSRMQSLMNYCKDTIKIPVFSGQAWLSDENISIDKECWLHPSRQKMFYPVAVGTVDQLIESVQTIKYGLLRLLALSGKTIIIDEMHAYDAYMLKNLEMLLNYCGWLGISVIVLSATLPERTKQKLLSKYSLVMDGDIIKSDNGDFIYSQKWPLIKEYPLITELKYDCMTPSFEFNQYACDAAFRKEYKFKLTPALGDEEIITDMAKKEIKGGGCLTMIFNTVDAASRMYRKLQKCEEFNDVELILVHGQCTLAKKDEITDMLNKKFGKDRKNRPSKAIVIATQVIEQSLDVDFDFMFTEIAPVDLLIQRFGRYHRHNDIGTIRNKLPNTQPIKILIPKESGQYGIISKIYDTAILDETLNSLKTLNKKINTPNDTRILIDSVYNDSIIDQLSETGMINCALSKTLNSPYKNELHFYKTCKNNSFVQAETRLTTYKSYNIAIVDIDTFNELKVSKNNTIDIAKAKKIMKENTICNVAEWKIKDKNGDLFDDSIHIKSGELKGYLNNVDIYCADENGIVYGFKNSMTINNGELLFGL